MGRVAGVSSQVVRERLLAAAAEVFHERGYEGASTGEIARRAGLSVGAIYSNYGTKAELLGHAIAAHIPVQLAELFAAGSPGTALDLLTRLAEALPGRSSRQGAMLIESFAAARRDPAVAKMITAGIRHRRGGLREAVERAQHDGLARSDLDAEALAHLCMTVVLGSLVMNGLELPGPDPAAWAAVVDHLIASVAPHTTSHDPEG
ncbi:TetR/AcrR family transcriptional regulator [Actinomadura sp. 9N407]|uniref:TetR/AcrR family transcriptional regulator n=1 Tax=Actinomadura sp. 9N407 TaxID=3375154 RepID=UPI0037B86C9D